MTDFETAEQLIADRKYGEARDIVAPALVEDPANSAAHFLMGLIHRGCSWDLEAFYHLRHAVKLSPDDHRYRKQLAVQQYRCNGYDAASTTASSGVAGRTSW